jgi:hypothetical protein
METGLVKFLKYIAGLMIMVKMEEILYPRQSQFHRMRRTIRGKEEVKEEAMAVALKI